MPCGAGGGGLGDPVYLSIFSKDVITHCMHYLAAGKWRNYQLEQGGEGGRLLYYFCMSRRYNLRLVTDAKAVMSFSSISTEFKGVQVGSFVIFEVVRLEK